MDEILFLVATPEVLGKARFITAVGLLPVEKWIEYS